MNEEEICCHHFLPEEQVRKLSLQGILLVYWVESLPCMGVHLGKLAVAFLGQYKIHMAEIQRP